MVTFLEVIKGSKEQAKKVNVRGSKDEGLLHPALKSVVILLLSCHAAVSRSLG